MAIESMQHIPNPYFCDEIENPSQVNSPRKRRALGLLATGLIVFAGSFSPHYASAAPELSPPEQRTTPYCGSATVTYASVEAMNEALRVCSLEGFSRVGEPTKNNDGTWTVTLQVFRYGTPTPMRPTSTPPPTYTPTPSYAQPFDPIPYNPNVRLDEDNHLEPRIRPKGLVCSTAYFIESVTMFLGGEPLVSRNCSTLVAVPNK